MADDAAGKIEAANAENAASSEAVAQGWGCAEASSSKDPVAMELTEQALKQV
jgi:hypothetical protein